jgi:hypothetical protein
MGASVAPSVTPGGEGLVLRIAADGGFVPPGFLVTRLPRLSVYADGRAIETGAVPAIYPGPAVTPLIAHRLGPDDLTRLAAEAREAGLAGPDRAWSAVAVADVETTVLTVVDAAGIHRHSFYALGFEPAPNASQAERAARLAARSFIDETEAIVGATASGPFDVPAYRIYALPADRQPASIDPAPNVVDWPAGLPSLATLEPLIGSPLAADCGVIQGDDLPAFKGVLARATQITRYREAGADWTLLIRPLLPDEDRDCAPTA